MMRPLRHYVRLCAAPILLIGVVVLGACDGPFREPANRAIVIHNRTATPLTFRIIVGDRQGDLPGPLAAGQSSPVIYFVDGIVDGPLTDSDGCTKGDVIAYDPSGREVARHPPGLCVDETWVIEP